MPGIPGQIISELGEIGKTVGTEVASVPKDIAGKALESLGATSGKKQGPTQTSTSHQGETKESGPWQQLDTTKNEAVKKAIARAALEQLARRPRKPKEPSVWEERQREEKEKKEIAARHAAAAAQSQLPLSTGKRPRGDLYGVKAKRAAAEMSRNVRQD